MEDRSGSSAIFGPSRCLCNLRSYSMRFQSFERHRLLRAVGSGFLSPNCNPYGVRYYCTAPQKPQRGPRSGWWL